MELLKWALLMGGAAWLVVQWRKASGDADARARDADARARDEELKAAVASLEQQRIVEGGGKVCPTCASEPALLLAAGELGESVCPNCQGRLLEPDATDSVLIQHRQWSPRLLKKAKWSAHARLVPCYSCKRYMGPITLGGTTVHLCNGCGRSFLPKGALSVLGEGRWEEVGAQPPAVEK